MSKPIRLVLTFEEMSGLVEVEIFLAISLVYSFCAYVSLPFQKLSTTFS